jgi:hypothetical protein
MREFIVTLRGGLRVTVRADRVVLDDQWLSLVLDKVASPGDPTPGGDVVALFERVLVALVVAKENLVSEEKGDPVSGPYTVDASDAPIPF